MPISGIGSVECIILPPLNAYLVLTRCVQLTWTFGQDNSAAWGDVIAKVKDGLLYAFDAAIAHREDEVKRSESQRQMPGWNFCTFFTLKVCQ
jgi:trafficking protein particle complex subunit 10